MVDGKREVKKRMNVTLKIAKKEITDALRNKLFLITLGLLLLLTVVSIILASIQVRAAMSEYNNSVGFLKAMGKTELPPAPNLNPLAASKGFVNYLGMIGALLAMILGNNAIVKERRSGTLKLLLSRPVFRDSLLNGKLLGNLGILALISALVGMITYVSLLLIGNVSLSGNEITRMIFFFIMSFLYMAFFLILAVTLSLVSSNGNKALLTTIILWLILAFVFPQIGDTMDMDNQLPGGFFAQMGMTRDQEHKVLEKFKFYETLRDSIEEMSPTKHYERVSFALLNVKPGFDKNTPVEVLQLKWLNLVGLTAPSLFLCFGAYMAFLRREDIY
jgi:ABC-2 type transport system permease protein